MFPATTTTGTYGVQNPPSGYPALGVSDSSVTTDRAFQQSCLLTSSKSLMKLTRLPALCPCLTISLHIRPLPAKTSTYTYPASPGLAPAVATTTPIPAVTATSLSIQVPLSAQPHLAPVSLEAPDGSIPRLRLARRLLLVKHVFQLQDLDPFLHLVGHLLHTENQKNSPQAQILLPFLVGYRRSRPIDGTSSGLRPSHSV